MKIKQKIKDLTPFEVLEILKSHIEYGEVTMLVEWFLMVYVDPKEDFTKDLKKHIERGMRENKFKPTEGHEAEFLLLLCFLEVVRMYIADKDFNEYITNNFGNQYRDEVLALNK